MLQHQSLAMWSSLRCFLRACDVRGAIVSISYIYARNIQWRKNMNLSTCPHDTKVIGAKVVWSLGAKINEPTPRRNNFIGSLGELNAGKMSVCWAPAFLQLRVQTLQTSCNADTMLHVEARRALTSRGGGDGGGWAELHSRGKMSTHYVFLLSILWS